ncbi:hypothetical protein EGJ22_15355 [Pseudomonas sp. p99-361]|nr:hypothetical protein HV87_15560 [Pseudomonas aeruginosa]QEQ87429.1 hypothetical protein F1602_08860 [Pseudomonas putida]RRV17100.1 hypothetical protein EGJ22_15355 [Pseudomonas sp. p99-361]RRV64480.1 hypothetical protein EGJ15_16865 [Pseudomonas sp. p99-361]
MSPSWPDRASGAALQPFRDTRPLLQGHAIPRRSGLVSRKGRNAAPAILSFTPLLRHPPATPPPRSH